MLSKLCLKNYKAFEGESFEVYPFRGWDEREIALSLPSP